MRRAPRIVASYKALSDGRYLLAKRGVFSKPLEI